MQREVANHAYLTSDVAHRAANVVGMLEASDTCSHKFAATLQQVLPDCHALRAARGPAADLLYQSIKANLKGAAVEALRSDADRAKMAREMSEQASRIRSSAAVMGGPEWLHNIPQ